MGLSFEAEPRFQKLPNHPGLQGKHVAYSCQKLDISGMRLKKVKERCLVPV